jgi:hypothetical protein
VAPPADIADFTGLRSEKLGLIPHRSALWPAEGKVGSILAAKGDCAVFFRSISTVPSITYRGSTNGMEWRAALSVNIAEDSDIECALLAQNI